MKMYFHNTHTLEFCLQGSKVSHLTDTPTHPFYTQAILGHIYHLQAIIFEIKLKAYFYIPPWVGPSGWTLSTGQFTIEDRISVLSDTLEQCEHLLPKISL